MNKAKSDKKKRIKISGSYKKEKRDYDLKRRLKNPNKKREYRQLNKDKIRDYNRKYYGKNREKVLAMIEAGRKIKIPENQKCEVCDSVPALDKHHEDYSKRLEVVFCCKMCHAQLNIKRKTKEKENLHANPKEAIDSAREIF